MDLGLQIDWLGHAGFCFTSEDKILYVDPYELKNTDHKKADLIFITHAHYDHLSEKDIARLTTSSTIIIAPKDCMDKISWDKNLKVPVEPNKAYTVQDFSFRTIPAYNINPSRLKFHKPESKWVGYILTINGKEIYHAGDTDFIPEMRELSKENLNIALLPIGGTYTMDTKEAIEAANAIAAVNTIPMHYKTLLREAAEAAAEEFIKGVSKSEVRLLSELDS